MIDIEKMKQAALDVMKYSVGSLSSIAEFDDMVHPEAVLELITRLEAATDQLAIDRKHRMEELENIQDRMTEYHRERVELKQKLAAAEQDAARWKAFERCGEKLLFKENFGDKSRSYWHFNTKDSLQYIYKTAAEAVDAFISWNKP